MDFLNFVEKYSTSTVPATTIFWGESKVVSNWHIACTPDGFVTIVYLPSQEIINQHCRGKKLTVCKNQETAVFLIQEPITFTWKEEKIAISQKNTTINKPGLVFRVEENWDLTIICSLSDFDCCCNISNPLGRVFLLDGQKSIKKENKISETTKITTLTTGNSNQPQPQPPSQQQLSSKIIEQKENLNHKKRKIREPADSSSIREKENDVSARKQKEKIENCPSTASILEFKSLSVEATLNSHIPLKPGTCLQQGFHQIRTNTSIPLDLEKIQKLDEVFVMGLPFEGSVALKKFPQLQWFACDFCHRIIGSRSFEETK